MPLTLLRCLLGCLVFLASELVMADEVQVAVASNFIAPMKMIAADFEKETGHQVVLSFGSTGKFYSQIVNGAPFHVFLAADEQTPLKLDATGAAVKGTRFTYATGKLVLWSAIPGVVDAQGHVLGKGDFEKIAIAAPKVAPYGEAAMQTLTQLGLMSRLKSKLVTGESIGQAYSFVATGNARLGFVAMSQVYENGKLKSGSAWIVPARLHEPLHQDAVLLSKGKHNKAAAALLAFLKTDKAKTVIRYFGYES